MGLEIGALHVRRSIFIQATPERVWREFETFEAMRGWFGRGHSLDRYEPRLGGTVMLSIDLEGRHRAFGGPIVVFETGAEVSFACNWVDADMAWPVPTMWTLRLTSLYDGVHAEIFHHGFERLGVDAADHLEGLEGGWDVKHLKALRAIVAAG